MQLDRRGILVSGAALVAIVCAPKMRLTHLAVPDAAMAAHEARAGGRLGVFILDTASGKSIGYRHNELFGMCSTFKLALAAAVLRAG